MSRYFGTDSGTLELPTYVDSETGVLGYYSFSTKNSFASYLIGELYNKPRMNDVFNVKYTTDLSTKKRVEQLVDYSTILQAIDTKSIYPLEIDLGSYTIENMEQYTKFSSKCFTSIPTSISNGTAVYVTFGDNGQKVAKTKYTSDNKSQLDIYLESLKNDSSYFPVKVEFETLNYYETNTEDSYVVTNIEYDTFNCTDLDNMKGVEIMTLPRQLQEIGNTAFQQCSFKIINIPGTLTKIGKDAFTLNNNLTTINFDGTQAQWNAITRDDSDGIKAGVKVVCTDGTITIS